MWYSVAPEAALHESVIRSTKPPELAVTPVGGNSDGGQAGGTGAVLWQELGGAAQASLPVGWETTR